MKILCCVYHWYNSGTAQGIGGAETYLLRLIKYLRSKGHEIKLITAGKEKYEFEGFECHPQGEGVDLFRDNNEVCQWCDVMITQVIGAALGYNKANQHKKPLIFIAHNSSHNYPIQYGYQDKIHILYNTYTLRDHLFKYWGHFNGFVLHPLMADLKRKNGKNITLINCNHNKGGHIFAHIAERLPQFKFQGIYGGYGDQIEANLPNITYKKNKHDIAAIFASTRILLMPSEFESYGQVGTEAMQAGIPVIAHPCPGVVENLGEAGIFVDRNNIQKYCDIILHLMNDQEAWQKQSDLVYSRYLNVAEKSQAELEKFDQWLAKIA